MLSIQTNVNSMNAQENLRVTNNFQARTIARLTSGYRINQSGDDAAGLAVANKYRSGIAEMQQGVRNANDALSSLQIIDGGLSNISNMLDRLKTLATQSASATFEGNRGTLQAEYSSLLTEINRQASNIGLGDDAGSGQRYNKDLQVYVGGGGDFKSNSSVSVNLSLASDRVSSTQLGLVGSSILGGSGVSMTTGARTDLNLAATRVLGGASGSTQAFTVNVEGTSKTFTVTGAAGGITVNDALDQINNQVASMGIQAGIDANGGLMFISDKAWSVQTAAASTAAQGLTTAASNKLNTNLSYAVSNAGAATYTAVATTKTDTFRVTNGQGQSVDITLDEFNGASIDSAINTINAKSSAVDVYAVKNAAGTGIALMSKGSFSVVNNPGALDANDDDTGGFSGATAPTVTAGAIGATDDTTNSKQAIAAVNSAVSRLGIVQGKIGSAQNKVGYAIQLAQSQITSFSAAESRIRDADVASEAANLTKAQVLQQASLAALAQANSAPQAVLTLLRG